MSALQIHDKEELVFTAAGAVIGVWPTGMQAHDPVWVQVTNGVFSLTTGALTANGGNVFLSDDGTPSGFWVAPGDTRLMGPFRFDSPPVAVSEGSNRTCQLDILTR